jgi:hypothetical protein
VPRHIYELHAGFGDILSFLVFTAQPSIDDDVDSHLFQMFISGSLGLAAAIQVRCHLAKISHTDNRHFARQRMICGRMGFSFSSGLVGCGSNACCE